VSRVKFRVRMRVRVRVRDRVRVIRRTDSAAEWWTAERLAENALQIIKHIR